MYRPGKEMLLADALSHLPSQTDTQIKLNLRVNAISISAFTRWLPDEDLQWKHNEDPILLTVRRLTLNGWPARCTNMPRIARNYWDFYEMNSQLRMIYSWKVNKLSSLHIAETAIMDDLHKSHAGINKALALARTCVSTGQEWKPMWQTISRDAWHA